MIFHFFLFRWHLSSIVKVFVAIDVRRNDQLGIFTCFVCRSSRRAGQSGFTGEWFVAGFAHQGERRRRRSVGFQGVFSVVRRESGGRRPQQETLLADIASTKAAIEKDAAEVKSIGADINSLRPGLHHQTQSRQQRQLFARKRRRIRASQKPSWWTRWTLWSVSSPSSRGRCPRTLHSCRRTLTHEQSTMSFPHSPR